MLARFWSRRTRPSVALRSRGLYTERVTFSELSSASGVAVDDAGRLRAAAAGRTPCAPIRDLVDAADVATAYAIQSRLVAERVADGARPVGRKIGLTNPKVQAQLGVGQPDFGVLLDDTVRTQAVTIAIDDLLQPRIEAELAVVLAHDLDRAGAITAADVAVATAYVCPALEIVDSRIAGWDISFVDTVADNASSGLFVLGDDRVEVDAVDLVAVTMIMRRGSEIVSTGSAADCLGSPLAAVAWLAMTARDLGAPLRSGDIVLSGALGPMVAVTPGSTFTALVAGIGSVSARFDDGRST